MKSMEVKLSSRKRKSNTLDDVGHAQKISVVEKAAPNHKEGSALAKATMICFNCGERLAISPIDSPKTEEVRMFKAPQPTRQQPKTQRARSATIVDRRVTLLFNAATHVLALL
jgi:hypothetical protein